MEGDGKTKVVHQNLLLPLFFGSSDHTNVTFGNIYQNITIQCAHM